MIGLSDPSRRRPGPHQPGAGAGRRDLFGAGWLPAGAGTWSTGRSRSRWPGPSPRPSAPTSRSCSRPAPAWANRLPTLCPASIHAVDADRQLIVSTHTISLQEQIETQGPAALPAAVLRGRATRPLTPISSPRCWSASPTTCARPASLTPLPSAPASSPMTTTRNCSGSPAGPRQTATGLRHELQPPPAGGGLGDGQRRLLLLFPQVLRRRRAASISARGPGCARPT